MLRTKVWRASSTQVLGALREAELRLNAWQQHRTPLHPSQISSLHSASKHPVLPQPQLARLYPAAVLANCSGPLRTRESVWTVIAV